MKKRMLAILMTIAMVGGVVPITSFAGEDSNFKDTKGHWASAQIDKWSGLGIVRGSDGYFRPDAPITRGEMAVILDKVMGYQKTGNNTFSDLDQNFYTDAVLKINAAGVMVGDGDKLRPKEYISRQEAAVMMGRALDIAESNGASSSFADNDVIGSWAKGYVNAMSEKGLISGVGQNRFAPTENITRGAVVTILDHAIKGLCTEAKEYVGNVDGTVIVNANGAVLKNMVISGDLIIAEGVGKGDVTLDHVTVSGKTIVRGGGESSIYVKGSSQLGEINVIKISDGAVSIKVAEDAKVDTIIAQDGSLIVSGKVEHLSVTGSVTVTTIGATIKDVNVTGRATVVFDKDSKVETLTVGARSSVTVAGTVTKLVVSSSADDATIEVAEGATVSTLVTAGTIKVDNKGVITKAEINADDVVIGGKVPTTTVIGKEVKTLPVDKDGKTIAMTAPAETPKSSGGGGGGGGGSHSSNDVAVSAITITGNAVVGATLTAAPTPDTATVKYQWMRCDTAEGIYAPISGAVTNKYTTILEDAGKFIKVTAVGTGNYTGAVSSVATAKVLTVAQTEQVAADAVVNKINALPKVEALKLSDENAVSEAIEAYNGLTDVQRALVPLEVKHRLTDATNKMVELLEAEAELTELADSTKEEVITEKLEGFVEKSLEEKEAILKDIMVIVKGMVREPKKAIQEKIKEATDIYDKEVAEVKLDSAIATARTVDGDNVEINPLGAVIATVTYGDGIKTSDLTNLEVSLYKQHKLLSTNVLAFDRIDTKTKDFTVIDCPFNIGSKGLDKWSWNRGAYVISGDTVAVTDLPDKVVVKYIKDGITYVSESSITLAEKDIPVPYTAPVVEPTKGNATATARTVAGDNKEVNPLGAVIATVTYNDDIKTSDLSNLEVSLYKQDKLLSTNVLAFDRIDTKTKDFTVIDCPFNLGSKGLDKWSWNRGAYAISGDTVVVTALPDKVVVKYVKDGITYVSESSITLAEKDIPVPYTAPVVEPTKGNATATVRTVAGDNIDVNPLGAVIATVTYNDDIKTSDLSNLEVCLYKQDKLLSTNVLAFDRIDTKTKDFTVIDCPFNIGSKGLDKWSWNRGAYVISGNTVVVTALPDKVVVKYVKDGITYVSESSITLAEKDIPVPYTAPVVEPTKGNATATAVIIKVGKVAPHWGVVSINLTLDGEKTYADVESLKIELLNENTLLATNTLRTEELNETEKAARTLTSPFHVGRTNDNSDYAWVRGTYKIEKSTPTASELPNKVVATYMIDGITYVSESQVSVELPVEKGEATATARTVAGDNKEVNPLGAVSINLKYGENIRSKDIEELTIKLYKDETLLATNVLQPVKLNDTQKALDNITSPFNLGRDTVHDSWAWVRGTYKLKGDKPEVVDLPDKVVATYVVKGITYVSESSVKLEGKDIPKPYVAPVVEPTKGNAPATARTVAGDNKEVNPLGAVSINLKYGENIRSKDIEELTIKLYKDETLLATNVLQPVKLNDTQKALNNITSPFNLGRDTVHDSWAWVRGIYKLGTDKSVAESDLPNKVIATYVVKGITYVSESNVTLEEKDIPKPYVAPAPAALALETSQVDSEDTSDDVVEVAVTEGTKAEKTKAEETMIESAVPAVEAKEVIEKNDKVAAEAQEITETEDKSAVVVTQSNPEVEVTADTVTEAV